MTHARLEQINLNLLLALDALLVEENVTRAARRIGVTQPAMSRSLSSLRALLGDEILIRVGNEMVPTPYAASMRDELRHCLADLERILRTSGDFDPSTARGTLRIAAAGHLIAHFAPGVLNAVRAEAPGLDLRFEQLDSARLVDAIAGGVDLALGPAIDLGSTLESRIVAVDRFACLVRSLHPRVDGELLDLERYLDLDHLMISPTGRGGSNVDAALERIGAARRVVLRVDSFLLAPAIVAQTDLVLTAPLISLRVAESLMRVRVVEAPVELAPLRIALYWDPRRTDDPRIVWLRSLLIRAMDEAGGKSAA